MTYANFTKLTKPLCPEFRFLLRPVRISVHRISKLSTFLVRTFLVRTFPMTPICCSAVWDHEHVLRDRGFNSRPVPGFLYLISLFLIDEMNCLFVSSYLAWARAVVAGCGATVAAGSASSTAGTRSRLTRRGWGTGSCRRWRTRTGGTWKSPSTQLESCNF